ncbi:MAG: YdbH domain-containing protein [Pseudomonadota bacterium]
MPGKGGPARVVCFLAVLILALIAVAPHVLPGLLEPFVIQKASQTTGVDPLGLSIRSLGFSGIELQDITLGRSLTVNSVSLDYSLASLWDKRLERIRISGVDVTAILTDDGIRIKGVYPVTADRPRDGSGSLSAGSPAAGEWLALLPDVLEIRRAVLNLEYQNHSLPVFVDLTVRADRTAGALSLDGSATVFGRKLDFSAVLDGRPQDRPRHGIPPIAGLNIQACRISTDNVPLALFQDFLDPVVPGFVPGGETDVRVTLAESGWQVSCSGVTLKQPFNADFRNILCLIANENGIWNLSGSLEPHLLQKLSLEADVEAHFGPDLSWGGFFRIKPLDAQPVSFGFGSPADTVSLEEPFADVKAAGKGKTGKMDVALGAASLRIGAATLGVSTKTIAATGSGTIDLTPAGSGVRLDMSSQILGVLLTSPGGTATLPDIRVPGKFFLSRDFHPSLSLNPRIQGAGIKIREPAAQIRDIQVFLPCSWPLDPNQAPGRFSAGDILLNTASMASVSGSIRQSSDGLGLGGTLSVNGLTRPGVPGIDVSFSGQGHLREGESSSARLDFSAGPVLIRSGDLKPLPGIKGAAFSLDLAFQGSADWDGRRLDGRARMDVANGEIHVDERKLSLKGITTSLDLVDAIHPRSAPGQVLTIREAAVGDIRVSGVRAVYTLESAGSLLVESAGFNWCGGNVSSQAMRVSSGVDDYSMALYCDRLNLSEILRQIGSFQAEGDGSLNGRIPIRYSQGNLSFEDGFLYSTPGMGGTIKVSGADVLLSGIPKDSVQYSQIDLAREALRNYRYDWARLHLNTRGDTLSVTMEFDGKPENRLPFIYKKEINGFVRIDGSSPGSNFQGIKIDVNLDLPFNRFLKFGTGLNQLFK